MWSWPGQHKFIRTFYFLFSLFAFKIKENANNFCISLKKNCFVFSKHFFHSAWLFAFWKKQRPIYLSKFFLKFLKFWEPLYKNIDFLQQYSYVVTVTLIKCFLLFLFTHVLKTLHITDKSLDSGRLLFHYYRHTRVA